jgi:hypothetical protein
LVLIQDAKSAVSEVWLAKDQTKLNLWINRIEIAGLAASVAILLIWSIWSGGRSA